MKTLQSCILGSLHWNSRKTSAREAICVAFPAKPGQLPQERRTANWGLIWPETRRRSLRGFYPPLRRMPASRLSGRRPTTVPDVRRFSGQKPRPTLKERRAIL